MKTGIYFHIPFCRKACHYCDFVFSTSFKTYDSVISAMLLELDYKSPFWKDRDLRTIYFGGGTPSVLEKVDLVALMDKVKEHFNDEQRDEVTLEANPDDMTVEKIRMWKDAGITRLSVGVQSFFDEDLSWMNRSHSASQAEGSIKRAQDMGLDNISLDLIYGVPTSSDERWKANVETALSLQVPHISAYALTVEEGTALDHFIKKGKSPKVRDESAHDQFLWMRQRLIQGGMEQYEISNFAMPGKRAMHNAAYWNGRSYMGIGPGAHSFNGSKRAFNFGNNTQYARSVEKAGTWFEEEVLTVRDQYNEKLMVRLRTLDGLNLSDIEQLAPERIKQLEEDLSPWIAKKYLTKEGSIYKLTEDGLFFADGIASSAFWTEVDL